MSAIMIGKRPAGVPDHPNFNLLRRDPTLIQTNLGGRYSLPREFDTTKWAGGFYLEGQEAHSMRGDQVLVGTSLVAPGWEPWKYPEFSDGETKKVKHPLAGQLHKVAGAKEGENYILMCRPKEVQAQINHAYGVASIERMTAEQRGETLSVEEAQNDSGMLTDARLKETIGVERDQDELSGRSTAVHAQPPGIGRQSQRITR